MDIRLLTPADIPHVQSTNITNLPENYFLKYYLYHALSWPQLSYVAVDVSRPKKTPYDPPKISECDEDASEVGIGGEVDEAEPYAVKSFLYLYMYPSILYFPKLKGGLTLSTLFPRTERAMVETYGARYVSLHVRMSNVAALQLYRDRLGFEVEKVESKYYADGEDAYGMKMDLDFIKRQLDETYGDEGDTVGEEGRKEEAKADGEKGGRKRKVKLGRGLGVGDLVEKNESKG
ncbi:MAG: hypothetical protein Q9163_002517 [Psora crenata]